jgi:hypothetical protein
MTISNACPVQFWLAGDLTFNQTEVAGVNPACFCQIFNNDDSIIIQFTDTAHTTYNLKVLDSQGNEIDLIPFSEIVSDVWQTTYQPSAGSPTPVTDQKIQFKIIGDSTELAQSDCIYIRESHDPSVLIQYSNSNNYAGLNFVAQTPDTTFYLRIPASFFHETPTTEQEDLELSDDTIQTLWSKIGKKKLLETGYMPYYMHEKVVLILGCQFITIGSKDWIRKDAYEIDKGNKRYPLKRATVLLTDQDYIKRNLL